MALCHNANAFDNNQETINAETGDQVTQCLYGTTLASSGIATSHVLSQEIYPDSTGPSDRITYTYNRQLEKTSHTDQNGTVHQFDRDELARPTQDLVTTLGVGVDGSVRRIERAYDVRNNNVRITSFDNPTVGSGSVVNEVTFEFNDINQPIDSGQAHDGVVIPGTTPSVAMSYADGGDNTVRPTSITYPNGRTITRDYGVAGSITNKMNQVLSLVDHDSTVLAAYERLGLSTFGQQTSPQPDLRYTLISPTLSIDPATGDIYSGLDRFGRVKDVCWRDISAGTDLSRIEYGYDRASNRTWRENPSDPNREHDWLYAYDGLHRLSSAARGQLNTGQTAITDDQISQCWTLDPTGNWKGFQQDDNADGTADLMQTRTANAVNEITDITNTTGAAWATPTYDPNGNSLVQPRPDLGPGASMTGIYDAWNRMVKVLDGDTLDVLLENQFDGRNFRIVAKEYASGTLARTRDYYFTDASQCVEEHVDTSNTPRRQYVWGIRYIDDLVLRERDISPSGGLLGERLYFLADANWNTTAVVSDSGSVQERYEYDAYGNISYFAANFTPQAHSSYGVHYTYTSREWIPFAGLYYFRNRWYDPQLGRFSARDPIGYRGKDNSLYRYVSSRPLNYLDPTGHKPCCGGTPYDPDKSGCCNKQTYNKTTECCITDFIVKTKRSNSQCCLDAIPSGQAGDGGGGVICCDGKKISCSWNVNTGNGQSDFTLSHCIQEHENDHHDAVECTGKECGGITRPNSPGIDMNKEECGAYKVEVDCLESMKGTCVTAACNSVVQNRINQIRSYAYVSYGCVLSDL